MHFSSHEQASATELAPKSILTRIYVVHPARIKFCFTGSFCLPPFHCSVDHVTFKSLESAICLGSLLMGYWLPLSVSAV